jgi:hypothetical protein
MGGTTGKYSNIVIYDEKKRYYYLNPQKNRPLLDDEVRNMHISVMDQLRRSIQHTHGDVSVPLKKFSTTSVSTDHYKVSVPLGMPAGQDNNFILTGGSGVDDPAVLFAKGYYVFLTGDIEYQNQMYGSGNIDLDDETDKSKTLTPIPDLTTPTQDRRDIVYIDLHFEEVTAAEGTNDEIYYDSGILDPRVGTPTANRLRAVIDVRVLEDWDANDPNPDTNSKGQISKEIYKSTAFLGNYDDTVPPTEQHFRIPVAAIYRRVGETEIDSENIVDLLSIYDKRVMTLEEISYRSRHGGYDETSVFEASESFTGLNPQFPLAKLDEGAFATGINQGFGSEALNSNSVTPRILNNEGKFLLGALQVGAETGTQTYPITAETGPVELHPGEVVAHEGSFQHLAIGYDRGVTGVREYNDAVSIHLEGLTGSSVNLLNIGVTGVAGFSMHNHTGETGVYTQFVEAENYFVVDFKGRMGYNTATPGWDAIPTKWNVTRYPDPVNIVVDVNDSQRIRKHLFIDQDTYTQGDVYGNSWSIPGDLSKENKAYFGYTGVPSYGVTGSDAVVVVKPGIATQGLSGIEDYRGYTGVSGFYESYDKDGGRIFTIGDLGPEFDRVVKTLYGNGLVPLIYSDTSLRYLPTLGEISSGDVVTLSVDFLVGGVIPFTLNPLTGATFALLIEDLRSQLELALQTAVSSADISVHTLEDPYDESLPIGSRIFSDGKFIIRDKLSEIQSVISFTVTRGGNSDEVSWIESRYFGSGSFGGDVLDFKFAKLDLGEAADAWLFNGDVFFNGEGHLNRVTFSPNVIFRDDIFVYGNLYANSLKFDRASLSYLTAGQKIDALRYVNIGSGYDGDSLPLGGLTIGKGIYGDIDLKSMQRNKYRSLWLYINGDAKAQNFIADMCGTVGNVLTVIGNSFPRPNDISSGLVYFKLGGSTTDTANPYGLHMVDARAGVNVSLNQGYSNLRMDYGDGRGNYGQLNVDLRGNLVVRNTLASSKITAGRTVPVTGYDLFVNNNARIEGTLEVSNISYIGSGNPEDLTDIGEPQNVIIYKDGIKTVDNKPNGILRTKEFSIDQKIVLGPNTPLDYNETAVTGQIPVLAPSETKDIARVTAILSGYSDPELETPTAVIPVWDKDTMTYAADDFPSGVNSLDADLISAEEGITSTRFRYNLDKITLANLGTLKMRYTGRIDSNSVQQSTITDFVQSYQFDTPYFKDRDKGSVVDWFPDAQTTTSNNFVATVDLSLIDDKKSFWNGDKTAQTAGPQIYNVNRPLWIYIPLSSWTHYKVWEDNIAGGFYTIYLANRWIHVLENQNIVDLSKFVDSSITTDQEWKLGVFPRFKRVTKTTIDLTEDQYDAEWELELIVFPEGTGTVSDLNGRMFINYYQ